MSFLAGRLAATEGAYFLQESKHAAGRLADNLPPAPSTSPSIPSPSSADVLPEILRHSIPIKIKRSSSKASDPSLSTQTPSKWLLHHHGSGSSGSASAHSVSANPNPLRAYVSLPQATFGPKRWQIPTEHPHFSASTANDLRRDKHPAPPDPDKLKALMRGYSQISKAFAAATLLVFGGVTALSLYTAHKLDLHSANDVRTKGRDALQPQVDKLKERVENVSRRWHMEGNKKAKENAMIKEFSKAIGVKTSN
ncbi:hypothetical protein LUZ63_004603 [Rhynchospora breviuscula]|uniref:Uncharacterized protein n=1 Tax=Rhynchospora breviuscula TaxID=2022672 RepID=A0A9Q0CLI0_9POAL|nr:hypothetical protein LUZ63_004603 [Rhynchospora breviuscula]